MAETNKMRDYENNWGKIEIDTENDELQSYAII